MPVLATVRNTGSHTAHNIFKRYTLHMLTEDPQADERLWFGHTEPQNLPLIHEHLRCEEGPLVLTMRDPFKVWASWRKRKKPPDHTFMTMWSNLFALKTSVPDSFWLPIDTPDRNEYLDRLEERLEVELNRDWTPKGVFQIYYECEGGLSKEDARKFFGQFPFEQFGYHLGNNS